MSVMTMNHWMISTHSLYYLIRGRAVKSIAVHALFWGREGASFWAPYPDQAATGVVQPGYQEDVFHPKGSPALERAPQGHSHSTKPVRI